MKGRILSQSLRVDSYPSGRHGNNAALRGYCTAVHVSSLLTQDTVMIYLHGDAGPLGLLPGAVVVFYRHVLKRSRSGNAYCVNTAGSSQEVVSLEGPACPGGDVPRVRVIDLMDHLLEGALLCGRGLIDVGI